MQQKCHIDVPLLYKIAHSVVTKAIKLNTFLPSICINIIHFRMHKHRSNLIKLTQNGLQWFREIQNAFIIIMHCYYPIMHSDKSQNVFQKNKSNNRTYLV